MKNILKRLIPLVIALWLLPGNAAGMEIAFPADLPTIEALIDLHKTLKKCEDESLEKIGVSVGEQTLVSKGAKVFNDVRTTLDTKLNNAYSYLILAGSISTTANGLYRATTEYAEFTEKVATHVKRKPFVGWYYANANNAIIREVKHCQKLYAAYAASGINLWRASLDQKLDMLMAIRISVDRVRAIIHRASLYCSLITNGGWKPDYIWEILTSEVFEDISKALIAKWNT